MLEGLKDVSSLMQSWSHLRRLLLLIVFFFGVRWIGIAATLEVHVSPEGKDSSTGEWTPNKGGGFATLGAALRFVRNRPAADGATIWVHGGLYRLSEPIVLTPADSGHSAEQPLVIAAFQAEEPVFSGSIPLREWTRLDAHLWQCDVKKVLGEHFAFRTLFINGRRGTRARTPNGDALYRMSGSRSSDKPYQFHFSGQEILPEWATAGDVEVVAYEKWTDVRQFIRSVDPVNHLVTLSGEGSPHTRENGARYFIENAPSSVDQPGEWRLDRATGLLTAYFASTEDPNQILITVPRLHSIVEFRGDLQHSNPVKHVVLRGLSFVETDSELGANGYQDTQAAIHIRGDVRAEGATDCTIERCRLARLAGYGIELGRGCQRIRLRRNELVDLGAGGVRIGEGGIATRPFDAVTDNELSDSHLHELGRLYPPAVGVLILQSSGNTISHNHIHDLYYTAISVGWTWGYQSSPCHHNLIEFNHLHDIGKGLLSDMGAIYTLGPQPGTQVRNNLIHDVWSFTYGGWGLYPDEGSTGIVFENNVVYGCKSAGFHQHYGKENVIRNNVIAWNREHELMRTRDEDHTSFMFTRNIVLFETGDLLGSSWKNDRFVMDSNVYWRVTSDGHAAEIRFRDGTFEEWKSHGHDVHSLVADPQFYNAAGRDFRLRPESPALKLGFQPIDVSTVGPRAQ